jgi:hypothetical protein
MGECRRTFLVRLFTVVLPVITGVVSQNVRGREIWPATAGGGSLSSKRCVFYSSLLVLGGAVNFNCSRIASERRAGRSGYTNENYQSAQEGESVFQVFAFHDRVLK